MTAIPRSWMEFQRGGTAQRRIGYLDGTWMDPEDATPRKAKVRWEFTGSFYVARVGKVIESELPAWKGTIWYNSKRVYGSIWVGDYGFEFHTDGDEQWNECQCEHLSHKEEPTPTGEHEYTKALAFYRVRTDHGTFELCVHCYIANHMKGVKL